MRKFYMIHIRKLLNRNLYDLQIPLDRQHIWHSIKIRPSSGRCTTKIHPMKKPDVMLKPDPKEIGDLRYWNMPISTLIIRQLCSFTSVFLKYWKKLSRNLTWTLIMDLLKNRTTWKTGTQVVKKLPFVSFHMKENVNLILFHIKSRGVQGLAIVQITYEKFDTNSYFKNGEVTIEATATKL